MFFPDRSRDEPRVDVRVIRRSVPHDVPEPKFPRAIELGVGVFFFGTRAGAVREETLLAETRRDIPNGLVRYLYFAVVVAHRVRLQVDAREHELLPQIRRREQVFVRLQVPQQLIRHRVARDSVRAQELDGVWVPREVLEDVRRHLHQVRGAPRAGQVLVLGARQDAVHGVPELVHERLHLRVRQVRFVERPARGTEVAHQRHGR